MYWMKIHRLAIDRLFPYVYAFPSRLDQGLANRVAFRLLFLVGFRI